MKLVILLASIILGISIAVGLAIGLSCEECTRVYTEEEFKLLQAETYQSGYFKGFEIGFNMGWQCYQSPDDEDCVRWLHRPE